MEEVNNKKVLIVISNHNPENWAKEQKEGWGFIEYIPFPSVPAHYHAGQVWDDISTPLINKIKERVENWRRHDNAVFVSIQGETTVLYHIFTSVTGVNFVFPTTERVVEEQTTPNGETIKKSVFKFVRWR